MPAQHRYIAFLRAINVGGRVVKMDRLREIMERRIEKALRKTLGYEVETFVRTPAELAAALAHDPFDDDIDDIGGATLLLGFLGDAPAPAICVAVAAAGSDVDDLRVHGRELYWRCHTRISESKVKPKQLHRALGMPTTTRNVTTLRKLVAKYGGTPS